jgi:predicted SnoaL-like aldol condensation-catalyzing enzyme
MNNIDESARSKAIALKAIRGIFIERDSRVVQELFAPDYIQHNPTIPSGRDAISALVGSLPEGFRYEPERLWQKAASS